MRQLNENVFTLILHLPSGKCLKVLILAILAYECGQ